jgi:hypothetical protein
MEEWNVLVRKLQDEQEKQKDFENMAKAIFHKLCVTKIKDMRKFEQHLGPEYEKMVEDIPYPEDSVRGLLKNDDFFELSLKLRKFYH